VSRLSRKEDAEIRAIFLGKHPSAAMYSDFGDFAFFVLEIEQAHLVAGFEKIVTVSGDDLD
jgi:putative heme iron utilization protein